MERLRTPAQVTAFLRGIGYDLEARTDRYGSTVGTLAHNGRRANVFVEFTIPIANRDNESHAAWLRLSTEIDVAGELPTMPNMPGGMLYIPKGRSYFFPSLGRTARGHADISLDQGATPADVKAQLVRFWTAVEAYATANGGAFKPARKRDWVRERLPDDLVLTYPDETSIDRLLHRWGWDHPGGNFFPILDGGGQYGMVEGEEIVFEASGWKADTTLKLSTRNAVRTSQTLDFSKGMALGELRTRIRAFALEVRRLRAGLRNDAPKGERAP